MLQEGGGEGRAGRETLTRDSDAAFLRAKGLVGKSCGASEANTIRRTGSWEPLAPSFGYRAQIGYVSRTRHPAIAAGATGRMGAGERP